MSFFGFFLVILGIFTLFAVSLSFHHIFLYISDSFILIFFRGLSLRLLIIFIQFFFSITPYTHLTFFPLSTHSFLINCHPITMSLSRCHPRHSVFTPGSPSPLRPKNPPNDAIARIPSLNVGT